MSQENLWRVIEPPSMIGHREDRLYADTLKAWIELRADKPALGCIVISFHDDGFTLSYLGNEELTAPQVMERVQWVGDQLLKSQPDYRDFGKW